MKNTRTDSQKIEQIVSRHDDWTFKGHYSGRCMGGRTCPGIVCSPYDVTKAVAAVTRAIIGKVTWTTDNMGLDMIVYFPGLMSDPVDSTVPQSR